jgi:hypothetical protein
MNNQNKNEDQGPKRQLVRVVKDRVIEYHDIPPTYRKKDWVMIESNKSTENFFKKREVSLNKDLAIMAVVDSETKELAQLMAIPAGEDSPVEYIFPNADEAKNFIQENNIKPSTSVVPDEFKKQISDFFEGKICFFENAKLLFDEYLKERDSMENFNPVKARNLVREYEYKIIDILFQQIQ